MKKFITAGLCLLLGCVALELVCRFLIGLGDPPLYVTHPAIEYMLKPSASYRRVGNVFKTNRHGMRSDDMPVPKEANEIRILVLGDSIVNGGRPTDQDELASEIIKHELSDRRRTPVVVGNISAGTWSPPNLLAYIREYGTFDADLAVIVLNGADLDDVPSFGPLSPRKHPTRKPLSATGELVFRYVLPRVAGLVKRSEDDRDGDRTAARESCIAALEGLIEQLRADRCRVWLCYHPFRDELDADGTFYPAEPFGAIRDIALRQEVPFTSLASRYGAAVREGILLYRDGQHLNAAGQALLAEEMLRVLSDPL
ncbi:MAG: SGNH/GDSL hydrolase family protein [Verrucomicrobia bacterium]|jgi:hypothetical protein|nr:SGNH/GDSL hydrolase family protein [Verrucomicrobiota bacterium]MBT7067423.1 SGNH/GDSL hydrolase family protein [Verrucomicrobiota bacterium]MBT7700055.1 SGNH/GDSL hydrolase family protein [Verrucomicrobiota bacterium]